MNPEVVTSIIVDTAYHLHRDLGPGLMESVYEVILARRLEGRGLRVERQRRVPFDYDGMHFDAGLKVDLLVQGCVVVELKSVERVSPVHAKQVLTYLRLMHLTLGLLINFGAATFKVGVKRIINQHGDLERSGTQSREVAKDPKSARADGGWGGQGHPDE